MKPTRVLLLCASALVGCALLGKSDPLVPRYFMVDDEGALPAAAPHPELQLHLGRIESWTHLRERLVVRKPTGEILFDETRRWTEQPEVYLRRQLARAFFEQRGLVESLSEHAITLDVDLIAFEELEQPHVARMQARLLLRSDRLALLEETITVEQPVLKSADGDEARAVVGALSLALRAGVARIADDVVGKMAAAH